MPIASLRHRTLCDIAAAIVDVAEHALCVDQFGYQCCDILADIRPLRVHVVDGSLQNDPPIGWVRLKTGICGR